MTLAQFNLASLITYGAVMVSLWHGVMEPFENPAAAGVFSVVFWMSIIWLLAVCAINAGVL